MSLAALEEKSTLFGEINSKISKSSSFNGKSKRIVHKANGHSKNLQAKQLKPENMVVNQKFLKTDKFLFDALKSIKVSYLRISWYLSR